MNREYKMKWQIFLCKMFPTKYNMSEMDVYGEKIITITKLVKEENKEVVQIVGVY